MKIAYIDNDEVKSRAFLNAMHRVVGSAYCELLKDRIDVVKSIQDMTFIPQYIFIHFEFKNIPCTMLTSFIKKQEHLDNTRVIVVSEYFTRTDVLLFNELNVTTCLVRTDGLTTALTNIFKT